MPRGATTNLTNTANTDTGNANSLFGQLFPAYTAEANDPKGYGAGDLAAMNTASQQSVGGSTAGAVGQGAAEAARTGNAGAFTPALDESVRQGQRQLSNNALDVQTANANLKQKQQQEGLAGQASLYGLNSDNALAANHDLASQPGWFQNLLGGVNAAANAGKSYAAIANGGGGN